MSSIRLSRASIRASVLVTSIRASHLISFCRFAIFPFRNLLENKQQFGCAHFGYNPCDVASVLNHVWINRLWVSDAFAQTVEDFGDAPCIGANQNRDVLLMQGRI